MLPRKFYFPKKYKIFLFAFLSSDENNMADTFCPATYFMDVFGLSYYLMFHGTVHVQSTKADNTP